MENNITITPSASAKIQELILEAGDPELKLRTFVQGGGCSGFQYGFTFEKDIDPEDWVIEHSEITLVVDALSMPYLAGSTLDYKEDLAGSSFTIKNPNAETTCGCGSSFSI